jgi:hypothetical protein
VTSLLTRSQGRVEQRSAFGLGNVRDALAVVPRADFTHPVIAALDHPPFCLQNGGDYNIENGFPKNVKGVVILLTAPLNVLL